MFEGATLPATHDRKADRVLTHCLYRIATGKWAPGQKLPSVRAAEREWSVDRRTVLAAYRRLEQRGLVSCTDRSGYFVAKGPELGRLSRHRRELETLYQRWQKEIVAQTDLSPLGAFRYFAQLAAIRAAENPSCAFVECTISQAQGHAAEVSAGLGIPCLPLSLDEIDGQPSKIPSTVHCLLVSRFHQGELRGLKSSNKLRMLPVPIEVSPESLADTAKNITTATLFEADGDQAHDMVEDLRALQPKLKLQSKVIDDLEENVQSWIENSKPSQIALLSPRLWGRLPSDLKDSKRLREVTFRICEDAWPSIADSIGLPLGVLG